MHYLDGYVLTCPRCGYRQHGHAFDPSPTDECFCPECDGMFIFEPDDDEDEEPDE